MASIGYEQIGSGAACVLILNDWLCDTSTWDPCRPYLDTRRASWVFADLRGYGGSRGIPGQFNLEEAAGDVLAVADHLGWDHFTVLGHSMSTLVALHLAQHVPERAQRAIVVTPPPPSGFGADEAMLGQLKQLALADDASRIAALKAMWSDRLSGGWAEFKAAQWRASADPEAVAQYVAMFAQRGLPEPALKIGVPVLAITGEQDAPVMREETVRKFLAPVCAQLKVVPFAQSGHYPMQEMPPLFVATVERFL